MVLNIKTILHRLNRRDIPLFPKFKVNKYFKIVLIIFVVLSTIFVTKTILAQSTTSTTSTTTQETIDTKIPEEAVKGFEAKQSAMEEGNNQESWMKESFGSNAMVGINVLAGTIPTSVLQGKNTTWVPGGLIGFTNKSIAYLYNIPVSGVEYLAHVKNNFLGKPALAAGGYEGLSPLIPLWKGFRNATYILFSVIFVIIGIMIMLRVKISPQASITIQNSIPKIITSLILVTFSYAIVGLLIDFSYVIEGLGLSLILSSSNNTSLNVSSVLQKPDMLIKAFALVPMGVAAIIGGIVGGIITLVTWGAGWWLGILALIVIILAVIIFVFVSVIKFFFGLIKCYVNILLRTILAPFEIALGSIPNMKTGFDTWFFNIFANIMVFPVSLIFVILVKVLMDQISNSNGLWTPPGLEILSGGKIIAIIIGITGLTILSKLPKMIPEIIIAAKPSAFGKAIGEALSSKPGPVGQMLTQATLGSTGHALRGELDRRWDQYKQNRTAKKTTDNENKDDVAPGE